MITFRTDQDVEIYVERKAKEWLGENKRAEEKGGIFMLDTKRDLIISELPNINITGIGQCCNNRAKSAGGFIWRYYKQHKIEIINNVKLKIKI